MPRGSNASNKGKNNRRKQQATRPAPSVASAASNASTTTLVQHQPRPYVLSPDLKTVTPESPASGNPQDPPSKKQSNPKESQASPAPSPPPNVFEYLDDDDSSDSDSDSDSSVDSEPPQKRKANAPSPVRTLPLVKTNNDRPEAKTGRQSSFNSSSGVSARERSPDRASSVASRDSTDDQPATPPNALLSPIDWKFAEGARPMFSPQIIGAYNSYAPSILEGENSDNGDPFDISVPETFYMPRDKVANSPNSPVSPRDRTRKDSIQSKQSQPSRESPRSPSGYEQRSRKSSFQQTDDEAFVPPVYRKFETLNHRILLNLQNEIGQMEEDLRRLDELEAMHRAAASPRSPGHRKLSTSSHHDFGPPSFATLHFQRQELLEQVQAKIQQYSKQKNLLLKVPRRKIWKLTTDNDITIS